MFLQEKLLVELKRKREKAANDLKEARAGKRDADKRCRHMEEEKEAICDDYEGRLQQQVPYRAVPYRVVPYIRWYRAVL